MFDRLVGRIQGFTGGNLFLALIFLALVSFIISGCAGVIAGKSSTSGPGGLTITTAALSGGTVGAAYSATLQASGGTSPQNWSISTGALPVGLSLGPSTGVIAGKPTAAGSSSFTIQATDAANATASKALSINIAAASNPGVNITTSGLPNGQVSQIYDVTVAASGGKGPYTWGFTSTSGPLPAGLSLAASTGRISGTPSQAGPFSFTLQVSDSSATPLTGEQTFTVIVVGTDLDAFGGRTNKKCASATGWFHTEKIGSQWWLCTPLGNVFFMNGVEGVQLGVDTTYYNLVQTK
jgi:hypothetical protein